MKVLVVHDREDVAQKVCTLVRNVLGHSSEIDKVEDSHLARQHLSKTIYDLLIIDLTIPAIKGKTPVDYRAVDELLTELFSLGTLNIPGDVIGMTRDCDALKLVNTSLGPHLMVMIEEDQEGLWAEYLCDKIVYAQRAADTRSISVNRHYLYDALIVTAMDKEMRPYEAHFEMNNVAHFPGAKEFLFKDSCGKSRKGIAYSIGRSGQPSAASMSQALITSFRPQLALMSGYCGGVISKVSLGDLVFFESAYAWDYGKWSEESAENGGARSVFLSRPNPIDIMDQETHRVARDMVQSNFGKSQEIQKKNKDLTKGKLGEVSLHLCPTGSGSAVVANDEIILQIRGLNDSIWAVDMECYGFYHAGKNTNVIRPQFICIKSVSDYCNGEKGDDLHEACSEISSSAVVEILRKRWVFQ